jgi:hypothetical protein
MHQHQAAIPAALSAVVLLLAGCQSTPACSDRCGGGTACTFPSQCQSGVCLDGHCTTGCSDALPCAAGTYCLRVSHDTAGTGNECADHCGTASGEPHVDGDFTCIAGVPTPCASAPTTSCGDCLFSGTFHCPAHTFCNDVPGGGTDCVPLLTMGTTCVLNDECESGNCSGGGSDPAPGSHPLPSVCEIAAGATCTASGTTCAYCEHGACVQSCQGLVGDCQGGYCLGSADHNQFVCRVACDEVPHTCPTGYMCMFLDNVGLGHSGYVCLPS